MAESPKDVQRMALGVIQSRLMDGRQIMDEFRSVLGRDPTIRHSQTAAHALVNQSKNRYTNVLPYDHNRVILRVCACTAAAGGAARGMPCCAAAAAALSCPASSDYINASHVVHSDAQCGFFVHYIAAQGPTPSTEADFWRMCVCERVGAVVMLTNTVERGVHKCSAYFPAQPGARMPLRGGAVIGSQAMAAPQSTPTSTAAAAACVQEVVAVSSTSLHGGDLSYTVLHLVQAGAEGGGGAVTAADPATPREVAHLHYNAWPDHGTPADGGAIRTMCDLVEPVRAAGGAVVVHCSAGIGRTGTFIAIDILRRRLAHLEVCAASRPGSVRPDAIQAALDLPELVHSLRRQRSGMVQTIEQYAFCYQAVYEELQAALAGGAGGTRGAGAGVGVSTPYRTTRR